jgi:hypothetical protein
MIAKAPAKIVLHHLIVILPFAREVFFLEFYDPPAAVTLIQNRRTIPARQGQDLVLAQGALLDVTRRSSIARPRRLSTISFKYVRALKRLSTSASRSTASSAAAKSSGSTPPATLFRDGIVDLVRQIWTREGRGDRIADNCRPRADVLVVRIQNTTGRRATASGYLARGGVRQMCAQRTCRFLLGSPTPKRATGTRFEQFVVSTSAPRRRITTAPGGCDLSEQGTASVTERGSAHSRWRRAIRHEGLPFSASTWGHEWSAGRVPKRRGRAAGGRFSRTLIRWVPVGRCRHVDFDRDVGRARDRHLALVTFQQGRKTRC